VDGLQIGVKDVPLDRCHIQLAQKLGQRPASGELAERRQHGRRLALGHGVRLVHAIDAHHHLREASRAFGPAIEPPRHHGAMLQHLLVAGHARDAVDQHDGPPSDPPNHIGHKVGIREVIVDRVGKDVDDHFGRAQDRLGQLAVEQAALIPGIEIGRVDE